MADRPFPIIDSHIHLCPSSELSQLRWNHPEHPLHRQFSVAEYAAATAGIPAASLEGYIFLETDRTSTDYEGAAGWELALREVEFLQRVVEGTPRVGEGHGEAGAGAEPKCLAIVPWAPVTGGAAALEEYVAAVEARAGKGWGLVKGFRYLVQDKARGTMGGKGLVEGLQWLGRRGFVFDLGVDQRSGGKWQLEEAVEMLEEVYKDVAENEKVPIIINHLCKPNLANYNQSDPSFIAWRTAMYKLSGFSKTYMKLSGCFSEMPDRLKAGSVNEILEALQPYLAVILATFGPHRIMFGSDWPVCTIGVEGAWDKWRTVVEKFCDLASLGVEDKIMIWSGTAIRAYKLTELME